ncbi:hypothetical protein [Tateyamaria sp. syn59]|uniref:hypothetical protein n=1 Tax=Tateyamaria sp. syn59 TaxID=2576942 RepID=UPI0011BE906B|nr:hypothetical protein [Tateyamaria sp. syn59]
MYDDIRNAAATLRAEDGNEADTRHKVIDGVLHGILGWPRNRTLVEEFIRPGFSDYTLTTQGREKLILIEAKRAGHYFSLPAPHKAEELSCYMSISRLTTDANIKEAMTQVRNYCMDTGCEYGAITNGHEWIFFKSFEKGKRWDQLKAFVVRSTEFFLDENTKAVNIFSYTSIVERGSLIELLTSSLPKDRQMYFTKDRIPSYAHPVNANRLAEILRPIANNLFGVIEDNQTELMDRCYVSEREYGQVQDSMKSLLKDSLTPYFKLYGVEQLDDTGKGGAIGGRIKKNIKNSRGGEVLVLFGGKGAGKSTFIKRLLKHKPPAWLRDNAVIAIADMLHVPEERELIRSEIWRRLVASMDADGLLSAERDKLIDQLFADKFSVARVQDLAGLEKSSELYNQKLNDLVSGWKSDHKYCAIRLGQHLLQQGRGVVVVVDNTDQYSGPIQDLCFSTAQEICDSLSCITLISMREERFHNSKIHGVLDAFQNSGFHLSSPKPATVFTKRLEYTVSLLRDNNRRSEITSSRDSALIEDCCKYLDIVNRGIRSGNSPLNSFLTACGHGDIRLTLHLFRLFLLSGYTNVEEMIEAGRWTFQLHQVIKPVMTPTRFFYDEMLSDIPNIYQLRNPRHASHFTALRILDHLSKAMDSTGPDFVSVAEIRSHFVARFQMEADLLANMDVLLKCGFIEANNRIDEYSETIDRVKVTSYGLYMLNELSRAFTYLDLIYVDCAYFDERVCNEMTAFANDEYSLFLSGKRTDRVSLRLQRCKAFIEYLRMEEDREFEVYGLERGRDTSFTGIIEEEFSNEEKRVALSASKQTDRRARRR